MRRSNQSFWVCASDDRRPQAQCKIHLSKPWKEQSGCEQEHRVAPSHGGRHGLQVSEINDCNASKDANVNTFEWTHKVTLALRTESHSAGELLRHIHHV